MLELRPELHTCYMELQGMNYKCGYMLLVVTCYMELQGINYKCGYMLHGVTKNELQVWLHVTWSYKE